MNNFLTNPVDGRVSCSESRWTQAVWWVCVQDTRSRKKAGRAVLSEILF